ncbi:hypothetical protein K2173_023712 [Erythroxylum novogranatense]|uniref:Uncharacterized protein n=1 Tax=Erythroxylum novogranatense TaxID=1862640 RepID=A0AAV8TPT9_9ROSI|nr:hypothetical protein K2173_023712 [Erythroxylum novogranatense]
MAGLWFYILLCFNAINGQQYYDPSGCWTNSSDPGSRYTCKSSKDSCNTFIVYRANRHFRTIQNVSQLFEVDAVELLHLNKLTSQWDIIETGREVLVPIKCSCRGQFFQRSFNYVVPENKTLPEVACIDFEGLLKSNAIVQENPTQENDVKGGTELHVPLKCACPGNFSSDTGVRYLVTYPLMEGDRLDTLSKRFGISLAPFLEANGLGPWATIYPNTTLLVPLEAEPTINFSIPWSPPPIPSFLPTETVETSAREQLRNLYIVGSVVGFVLLIAASVACGLYVKALHSRKIQNLSSFNTRSSPVSLSPNRSSPRSGQTGRSSTPSCLSPDLLVGIKYSLKNFSVEDLRRATSNFSEEAKIGEQYYKGLFDNVEIMIKQMRFEDTRRVIDVHSKINHINIVNLLGVCYGENDFSWSYLLFELPGNGCLRDCLSNPCNSLRWQRRTRMAFDIATGLHYLHYCIFPPYAHMRINSRNIFVTADWRAKLTNIRINPANGCSKDQESSVNFNGGMAPECYPNGSVSEKIDIFAFGVVLLELISGREDTDGKTLKESIAFLGRGASEGGCFEQLKSFVDPCLKEDYPLAEALGLAVLAMACVEDDPQHRPSMDDILKVLGRMV